MYAFAHRSLLMASRNVFFVFELVFWPLIGVVSIGLMARFLNLSAEESAFVLIGTMALSAVQVCQLDVAYAVLFDVWSKSIKHQFLAPIQIRHLALGAWLMGVARGLAVFALMAAVSSASFGFDFLAPGWAPIALFLLGCFLTAAAVGLFVCALIVRFGTRAEVSAWSTVNLVLVLCGLYYPISVLPEPAARVAAVIPLTYFLDAFRVPYGFPAHFERAWLMGFGLSAGYLLLGHWALASAIARARRTGLLLKLSE